jgi:hypothetical protein
MKKLRDTTDLQTKLADKLAEKKRLTKEV